MAAPAGCKVLIGTNDYNCPVCFEPMLQCAYLNPCRHSLCGSCALQLDGCPCPLCRTKVRTISSNRDISAAVAARARYTCLTCGGTTGKLADAQSHRCKKRHEARRTELGGRVQQQVAVSSIPVAANGVSVTPMRQHVDPVVSEAIARPSRRGESDRNWHRRTIPPSQAQVQPRPPDARLAQGVPPTSLHDVVMCLLKQGFSKADIAIAAGFNGDNNDRDVGGLLFVSCPFPGPRRMKLVAAFWKKASRAAASHDGQAALETAPAHRRPSEEGAGDANVVATQPRRARSPVPVPESEPAAGGGGDNDSPFGAAFRALQFGVSPQRAPQPAAAVQSATPVRRHVDPVGPQTVVRRATPPPAARTPAAVPSTVSVVICDQLRDVVNELLRRGLSFKQIARQADYQGNDYKKAIASMLEGRCERRAERLAYLMEVY